VPDSVNAAGAAPAAGASLAEALDHRVDTIIKEWHHNSDLVPILSTENFRTDFYPIIMDKI
jgi:hypothetical protein